MAKQRAPQTEKEPTSVKKTKESEVKRAVPGLHRLPKGGTES